jgi:hypothetical protein
MSLSASVGVQIPTNVVEVGNEISQNSINALAAASSPATVNPFMTSNAVSATYATKASPTFTGTVTIPAGASISGYATQSYVTSQGYLTDAPSNGSEYVRKNGAWSVVTGGGGGISDAPSDGNTYARQNGTWVGFSTTPSVTNIDLTGNFNGYSMGSGYYTFKFDSTANTLRMQDGVGSGITISSTGITFPDATTLTTATGGGGGSGAKSVNQQTSNWTLNAGDTNNIVYFNAVMGTLTIPDDASYSFPVGTHIMVATYNCSIGVVANDTMTPAPIIFGTTSFTTGIYHLIKVAANTWIID